jgi:hypothetical protein
LPGWLDRLLPEFHVEAPTEAVDLVAAIPQQRVIELDAPRTKTPTS